MAFAKTASAKIKRASLGFDDWNEVRSEALGNNLRLAAADKQIRDYTPDKYLLTHCTIIASVDVDENGPKNDRGWPYYLTPETEKYINNNEDCWERDLLLATYGTFRGAENYVEHIQIPELSKGKIVDAVARDVGDSIYVDLLVATDRKHKDLVADIESGKITTLSMGCTVEYTICTQCGHIAHDDTDLCQHIKYQKGNNFIDPKGKTRKIAELCGHKSDPSSVKFIEASWVANPAFKGAVMRNILGPEAVKEAAIKAAFEMDRSIDPNAMQKAASALAGIRKASTSRIGQFDFDEGGEEAPAEGEEEAAPAEEEKDPLDEITSDLKEYIRDRVLQDLRQELQEPSPADTDSEDTNENLVRSSFAFTAFRKRYASYGDPNMLYRIYEGIVSIKTAGWKSLHNKGFTGREILAVSRFIDYERGNEVLTPAAYRAIAKVGGTAPYETPMQYLQAIGRVMHTDRVSSRAAKALIYKGHLYSYGVRG